MTGTEIAIAVLIFISVLFFSLGIYLWTSILRERREVVQRIKTVGQKTGSGEKKRLLHQLKSDWVRAVEALGNRVKPKKEGQLSHLRKRLIRAGYRKENAPLIFLGMKALLAILFLVGFSFLRVWTFRTMPSLRFMSLSVLLALVGYYLPSLWVKNRIAKRREKMQEGLPEALDLMVVCVEAGNGLDAAINRVGEEMKLTNRVLSEEFKLLSLEMRAGKQRQDALRNLSDRTELDELNNLVTLLIQTDKFGTSIGQALRVHSDFMRTRRYQKAEEIAQKMPVKLIFPLFLFIFPAILVVVLGPAVISIFRNFIQVMGSR